MSAHRAQVAPTLGAQLRRASDRLVTPATVITVVVCGTVLVLATVGAAVWAELAGGRGLVVIDTVTKALAALGSLVASTLLWVGRHQLSRIEVAANAAAAPTPSQAPAPLLAAVERTAAETTLPPPTDSSTGTDTAAESEETPLEAPQATPEPSPAPEPAPAPPPPPAPASDDTSLIPVVRPR